MPGRRKAEPPSRPSKTSRPEKTPPKPRARPARTGERRAPQNSASVLEKPRPRRAAPPPKAVKEPRPPKPARIRKFSFLGFLWTLAFLAAVGGLVALQVLEAEELPRQGAAAGLGVILAMGLAGRSGGRPFSAGLLATAVGGAAIATQWAPALAGAAVATGVLAACLAVLGTTPAATFGAVIREVVIAQAVATAGALGVAGFLVGIDPHKFAYTVLALSMGAMLALVYRLGAGLHGLGTRGVVVGVAAIVMLAVALAYSEALSRWGSPGMTEQVDATRFWMRDNLGAVPHPIEVLLGIPALAWGVFMRARRRQGWWVCAFGAAATAPATSRFIDAGTTPLNTALAAGYSLVLGLILGYALIRLEQWFQGTHGRRARRGEEASARRLEPRRLQALQ